MIKTILAIWLLTIGYCWGYILSGDNIFKLCKEEMQKSHPNVILVEKKLPDIKLADGSLKFEITPSISSCNAIFDIKILVNEKKIRKIKTSFKIKRYCDVVVCLKEIRPGTIIKESDLAIENREIDCGDYIDDLNKAIGKEAKKLILKGSIIKYDYLKEPNCIKFGDNVNILKKGNGFFVQTLGKAMSSGYVGKKISVRNIASGKIIQGIIIDSNTVEVK